MKIKFSQDLESQEMYAHGDELARYLARDRDEAGQRVISWPESVEQLIVTLHNPVLVTDIYKICQEIADPTVRDTILMLYSSPTRVTEYNGTFLQFVQKDYPTVWGPSIDTLLLCQGLETKLEGVKQAVELGSGSGFISKYILEHAPSLERIELVDIDENAIRCARDRIRDKRAKFQVAEGIDYLKDRSFDLIVCNPPYIPRPGSIEKNPYEGVGLLHYLLSHPEHLNSIGKVITNFSSLCEDIAMRALEESEMEGKIITSMKVPLKVLNVLNNAAWMDFLRNSKGLRSNYKNGYQYWHRINIIEGTRR